MATCTTKTGVTEIVLRLSVDEAETLASMFGSIGGDPDDSPRKHTDAVQEALRKHGFYWKGSKAYRLLMGSFRFSPYAALENS